MLIIRSVLKLLITLPVRDYLMIMIHIFSFKNSR